MGRGSHLTVGDIRKVFYLLAELRELRDDPDTQQRRLIEGLIDALGADGGQAYAFANWRPDARPTCTSLTLPSDSDGEVRQMLLHWSSEFDIREDAFCDRTLAAAAPQVALALGDVMPDADRPNYPVFADLLSSLRCRDIVAGYFRHPSGDSISGISLHYRGAQRVFTPRQRRLFSLFVAEWERAHRRGLLDSTWERNTPRSPRQREVFERLVQGHTPKGIAFDLGLSVHTVREHITAIYRQYDISSREELMAEVIRRLRTPG